MRPLPTCLWCVWLLWLLITATVTAGEPVKKTRTFVPSTSEILALRIHPPTIKLDGRGATYRILVTGVLQDKTLCDLTHLAKYVVSNPKIVEVQKDGQLVARTNGKTDVIVTFGKRSVRCSVETTNCGKQASYNFVRHVQPIFSQLGCNAASCHGAKEGQNGFALSLFGSDPETDFEEVVLDSRGRRLFSAAPEFSLLLMKPAGLLPHTGGRRIPIGSEDFTILRQWILAGVPYAPKDNPKLDRITVTPANRVLRQQGRQQLSVEAFFADGTCVDVTRFARYQSDSAGILGVDRYGLVSTTNISGAGLITVKYMDKYTVFRGFVPAVGSPKFDYPEDNLIDRLLAKKWKKVGLVPSNICTDEQFLRRTTLDLAGRLPTPKEIVAFQKDKAADKRGKFIDTLVSSFDHNVHFANWWAAQFQIEPVKNVASGYDTMLFYNWLRESIATDKPHDQLCREFLLATGTVKQSPPAHFYITHSQEQAAAEIVSKVFLGVPLACTKCHALPGGPWGQDEYYGLVGFFGRVSKKVVSIQPYLPGNRGTRRWLVATGSSDKVIDRRTRMVAKPQFPGGKPLEFGRKDDPRERFADWLLKDQKRLFAKTIVNRYWKHFFHRALVPDADQRSILFPTHNRELLEGLATDFVKHDYSLRHLIKTICQSRAYQLSSEPNETNVDDDRFFSRYYPRKLTLLELYEVATQVLDCRLRVPGLPQDRFSIQKGIIFLPLEVRQLTKPSKRIEVSPGECLRFSVHTDAVDEKAVDGILQSEYVLPQLLKAGGRADTLASDTRPDVLKVRDVFLWTLGKPPTDAQSQAVLRFVTGKKDKREAYGQLLWTLMNTEQFISMD
ncbi:MAG: DUF1549 domain-containing protein [Gemmataceae bacterium]